MDRAVAAGRRMIVFSGHIANWEIAMLAGVKYGISVAQIYHTANNPLLDRTSPGLTCGKSLNSDRAQPKPSTIR